MYPMTIDGKPIEAHTTISVTNPATGAIAAQAPSCDRGQLDAAMDSAQAAFVTWRADESARRAAMLELAAAITAHADELTEALVAESGKPRGFAAMESEVCAAWLQVYAGMELPRDVLQDDDTARIEVIHRPMGVVAAITPWNFPLGLAMWKIAPALRAGNTVVLKPSPFSPLATLRLGALMGQVLPPGVVNTISGGDSLGASMTTHRVPRKISFTGSIRAGKAIAGASGADLKRLTLELGGNDAVILLDDVDVDSAAAQLAAAAFFNAGQACALPKRIFAPASRYGEIVEAFAAVVGAMRPGDPVDPDTTMGPLSTKPQFERVTDLVHDATANGARVVVGGHSLDRPGFFFAPTVFADCTDEHRIVAEEQFGPALPILAYGSVEEAVQRANATEYGLCGSVWSADQDRASAIAERLEVGTAYVNAHALLPPHVPFGGSKHSGIGVENGMAGLLSFTEPQVLHRPRA